MATPETTIIPQTRARRTYSDMEKARAMAVFDLCGNLTETANKTGIPDSTLSQWIRGQTHAANKSLPKLRSEAGLSLADNFEEIAFEVATVALRKLRGKGADKIPFGQLMSGASNAVNNSQLLRGLPTNISESIERQELVVILESVLRPEESA